MESRGKIIGEAIDEAVYLALEELRTSNKMVADAVFERNEMSDRASDDPRLDAHGHEALQSYVDLLDDLVDKQYRHLYRQGVTDCILLLRKLGVIQ